jgi:hypothetical protein
MGSLTGVEWVTVGKDRVCSVPESNRLVFGVAARLTGGSYAARLREGRGRRLDPPFSGTTSR